MRWTRGDRSNVEDVRGGGGGGGVGHPAGHRGCARAARRLVADGREPVRRCRRRRRHRCGRRPPGRVVPRGRKNGRLRRRRHGRHPEHVVRETGELPADACRTLPRLDPVGVRVVELGDGPVLLPGRPQGLSRPQLFRAAPFEARRARRFRAGLRPRARSRASRSEPDEHARRRSLHRQRERAFGARGVAGRLLCRRLGTRGGSTWTRGGRTRRTGSR